MKKKTSKKPKKASCKHENTDLSDCGVCGHHEEYCFDCEKTRCTENSERWEKVY